MPSARGNALLGSGPKLHLPHTSSRMSNMSVPWRRSKSMNTTKDTIGALGQKSPSPSPSSSPSPSPSCSHRSGHLSQTPLHSASPGRSLCVNKAEFERIFTDFALWRDKAVDDAVASLRTHIDDMWIQELTLGCDTELFSCILDAAAAAEAGTDRVEAGRRAREGATESEAIALKSLNVRRDARDCVAGVGGFAELERRIKKLRMLAVEKAMPYIELLEGDANSASKVRQAMAEQLDAAREDHIALNGMKTAKAEVMLELQDECSQKDWMDRQLTAATDFLEANQLPVDLNTGDIEHFFDKTLELRSIEDPLRVRTVHCLEGLRKWGSVATHVLDTIEIGVRDGPLDCDSKLLLNKVQIKEGLVRAESEPASEQQSARHGDTDARTNENTDEARPKGCFVDATFEQFAGQDDQVIEAVEQSADQALSTLPKEECEIVSEQVHRSPKDLTSSLSASRKEYETVTDLAARHGKEVSFSFASPSKECEKVSELATRHEGEVTPSPRQEHQEDILPAKRMSGHLARSTALSSGVNDAGGGFCGAVEDGATASKTPSARPSCGRLSCPPHLASLEGFQVYTARSPPPDMCSTPGFGRIDAPGGQAAAYPPIIS